MTWAVKNTPEFQRVRDLPRRGSYCNGVLDGVDLVAELTELLLITSRCPGKPTGPKHLCSVCGCPMRLRPAQALALHDLGVYRGLLGALGLGEGKTLVAWLAASEFLLELNRPLFLLPASLIKKTIRDRELLERHWPIPKHVRLFSYEMLGLAQYAEELARYEADGVITDEVHALKNPKAARTKRVARYMREAPATKFVALSGTLMSQSITEFAHIARWALKDQAPVPATYDELELWASALDVDGRTEEEFFEPEDTRTAPGALLELCTPDELKKYDALTAARRGYQRRLTETPGVVATIGDGERVDASIHVRAIEYKQRPETDALWEKVRKWKAPADDFDLISGAEVWKHAKALALGLTYVWNPRPPKEWLEPRKKWGQFVRAVLAHSRTLDSPEQVEQAVLAGTLDDEGKLARWQAVEKDFIPNVEPRWHDDSVLKLCAEWGRKPGLVWCEHTFFARRLAKETGWTYYGQNGLDDDGNLVDGPKGADGKRSIILSMEANNQGRNLQHVWSRNLIVSLKESGAFNHQLFGRTHRPGQRADEVTFDVLLGCLEHDRAWRKCLASARAVSDTTGQENKLLQADAEWPEEDEIEDRRGDRWQRRTKPTA